MKGTHQYNIYGDYETLVILKKMFDLKNITSNHVRSDNRIFVTLYNSGEFKDFQECCNKCNLNYEPA